jgi:hypothetical protein
MASPATPSQDRQGGIRDDKQASRWTGSFESTRSHPAPRDQREASRCRLEPSGRLARWWILHSSPACRQATSSTHCALDHHMSLVLRRCFGRVTLGS